MSDPLTSPDSIRSKAELMALLPPVWHEQLPKANRSNARDSLRKVVVLDDDPTGTQTVYDIPVLTRWDVETLTREFEGNLAGFYLLTNSRALTAAQARELNLEIARNLQSAAHATSREFEVVSRSDSTLRGHYPVETDALSEVLGPFSATFLIPYFEAGGRYTIHGVHYVAEGDDLVPASATPFARDPVFGFQHAFLPRHIEERTGGRINAEDVVSIDLTLLRQGPVVVARHLLGLPRGITGYVEAAAPSDLDVFVAAVLACQGEGRRYLFRTAAQFVAARLGLEPRPLWVPSARKESVAERGGLTVVGSHVPKTSQQLKSLLALDGLELIELSVPALLDARTREPHLGQALDRLGRYLEQARDVVVATSRELIAGQNDEANLAISRTVSQSLVWLVAQLQHQPRYLVAKGGITSSDIATTGLGVQRAMVLGQILPGIPVWELGKETKFPGLPYVVFPGNVGGPDALKEAVIKLRSGQ